MEKNTAASPSNNPASAPVNMLHDTFPRKHIIITVICVTLVVILCLAGFIYYLLFLQKETYPGVVSQEAAVSPTLVPPSPPTVSFNPSGEFIAYNTLSGEEKFAVANTFTDPLLKTSFSYPPGFYMQAIKAKETKQILESLIYFATRGNTQAISAIQKEITCVSDEKQFATGSCRTGVADDVMVSISRITGTPLTSFDTKECKKEIEAKDRVLLSCVTQMSFDTKDMGMAYTLYLLGNNPIVIRVQSRDPKTHAHLIRSILSFATNHL